MNKEIWNIPTPAKNYIYSQLARCEVRLQRDGDDDIIALQFKSVKGESWFAQNAQTHTMTLDRVD